MRKKRNLFFIFILVLALTLPLSFNLVSEVIGQTKDLDLTGYPNTPEGVVEAYCREDYNGGGLNKSTWGKLLKYTIFKKRIMGINSVIVSKYRVTKLNQTSQKAKVKVEYDVAGELFEDPFAWELKNPTKIGEVFEINLVKVNGYWKIDGPYELVWSRYISIEVAIRRLESSLGYRYSGDNIGLEYRGQIIRVLKKHRENPFNLVPYLLSSLGIKLKTYRKTFIPTKETLSDYPVSPNKVVEAFLKEDFEYDYEKRERYTLHGIAPPWSTTVLVLDYKLSVIKENSNTAWVKGEYKIAGYFARGEHGISFRTTGRTDEIYIFELVRHGGLWQIKSPSDHQYELIETKMKELEKYEHYEWDELQAKKILGVLRNLKR